MARFTAVVDTPAPPERTWKALTDWPSHGRWVPLTRVTVLTPSASGVGARFVGRTGLGPLAVDDPMEVVEWREPAP
ncbi:MAG TPA: SRPBCC family protein, partial [Kineosporiaceae bacterium]|nr:SRPBCC family protein [Kineosporiaceae bacterium]